MSDPPTARGGRLPPWLLAAVSIAGLLALLFADPLFSSRVFASRDVLPFFLPIEKAVHEAWRSGHVPLWMENVSFGRPLAANPNTGVFYPFRIAMALLPLPVAFKLFPLLHLWIAAMGAWLLAHELGVSRLGAFVAGTTYALSGPALSEVLYPNLVPALALLPWALWGATRLARMPGRATAAVVGAILGLMCLAGDIVGLGLATLGSTLLLLQESGRGDFGKSLRWFAAGGAVAVSIGAIQIVPAVLLTPFTVRALGRFPLGAALTWSVSLWRLVEFVVPFPFGNMASSVAVWGERLWFGKSAGFFYTFYAGAFAALAISIVSFRGRRRLFLVAFPAISIAAAVAGYYVPRSWYGLASPIPLRYPEKLMLGAMIGLALFSGLAFDRLRERPELARRSALVAAAVAGALLAGAAVVRAYPAGAAAFIAAHWAAPHHWEAIGARRLPGIFGGTAARWAVLAGLLFLGRAGRLKWWLPLLLLFIVGDLAWLRASLLESSDVSEVFATPAAARLVGRLTRGGLYGYFPLTDYFAPPPPGNPLAGDYVPNVERIRRLLSSDAGAAFGVRYAFNQDYDASDLDRVALARQEIYRSRGLTPRLARYLSAFSVRCTLVGRGTIPGGFAPVSGPLANAQILLNGEALPGVRFVRRCTEVRNLAEAYGLIHDRGHDLVESDVVETGHRRTDVLPSGSITVREMHGSRLRIETTTTAPARIVLPRAPFPFRRLTVDGQPVTADPTDLCLVSVMVPEGRHELVLQEELPGRALGPSLSVCGILMLGLLALRRNPIS